MQFADVLNMFRFMKTGDLTLTVLGQAPAHLLRKLLLPLFDCRVAAGFPSPADDYIEQTLDPHALLVRRPAATYFVRVSGTSMQDLGIRDGSILVVDRSLTACAGDVVIAAIGGSLTVKQLLERDRGRWVLAAANPAFPDLAINPEEGAQSMGVVTWSLNPLCMR